ncbi:MAG: biotin transporter BioY [Bacteroidota bacterium]|nr:biotin transporter BioY [Bacteroidota bacterium]
MEVTKKSIATISLTKNNAAAQLFWISTFAVLTALSARVEIQHYPVPFTLQTFFVLLSGAFLGTKNGFFSQATYIGVGALGLPVFAGGAFGLVKLFGPTGGYLFSFPIAAAVVGYLVQIRRGYFWTFFSFFVGLVIIFSCGSIYLNFVTFHEWYKSFVSGFLIFSWWDILKVTSAAAIYTEISKRYRKLPA